MICGTVRLLENPLVVAELQVVQRRHQGQVIAGQAIAGLAHQHIFDTPMNAFAIEAELQKRGLAEQAFQIEVRVLADQFNVDRVQGADGFVPSKASTLKSLRTAGMCSAKCAVLADGNIRLSLSEKRKQRDVQTIMICTRGNWRAH